MIIKTLLSFLFDRLSYNNGVWAVSEPEVTPPYISPVHNDSDARRGVISHRGTASQITDGHHGTTDGIIPIHTGKIVVMYGVLGRSKKGNYVEFHWLEIFRVRGAVIKNVRRSPIG